MTATSEQLRQARMNLRTTQQRKDELEEAARHANKSVSSFVLDAASAEARRILADRTTFVLGQDEWATFTEALDRPPRENPRLLELLESESVFGA